jgi:hypothetical protein
MAQEDAPQWSHSIRTIGDLRLKCWNILSKCEEAGEASENNSIHVVIILRQCLIAQHWLFEYY